MKLPEHKKANTAVKTKIRWPLLLLDLLVYLLVAFVLFALYPSTYTVPQAALVLCVYCVIMYAARFVARVYEQIWRYGGIQSYIRLLFSDGLAFVVFNFTRPLLPGEQHMFVRCLSLSAVTLLAALAMRMVYRYAYKCGGKHRFWRWLLAVFGVSVDKADFAGPSAKIKVAIVGAGRVGNALADELLNNERAAYYPCCFIDTDKEKAGRELRNLPVLSEADATKETMDQLGVQEVIFAVPQLDVETKKSLYDRYKASGYKVKVYDSPLMQGDGRKVLREFDIEELLFRKQIVIPDEKIRSFYKDKVILITGGGGSIGSEICRQLAKTEPRQLIILDVYENGAYDVQQELKIKYADRLDLHVEILSVCNKPALERVFEKYHPQIVVMAAAHKHVPLMENNCIEAVENNVFGTLNTVDTAVKYKAERVIMVSTDKAVNPTNIMGATKRMCEMIVQCYSARGYSTTFSATRFGNVLGSAGSVIPLFRRQISAGGPITLTDKRIIRYFMTIPEASRLVLQSGSMAKNGELFVLDMGQPVKIYDLAENMIRLSGLEPGKDIEIREIGLRPGEKLYEELLIRNEELDKTENELIFIERDKPITDAQLDEKLNLLRSAIVSGNENSMREAMLTAVPTYKPRKGD